MCPYSASETHMLEEEVTADATSEQLFSNLTTTVATTTTTTTTTTAESLD